MRYYLCLLLLLPIAAQAQQHIRLTTEAGTSLKSDLLSDAADRCRVLSDYSLVAGISIYDEDPRRLGFYGAAGLGEDAMRFKLRINGAAFSIERLYLPVRALIIFPTRYQRLSISAGIGIDFNLGINASVHRSDGAGYFQLDVDKAGTDAEQLCNRIIPSIQAGCRYELDRSKHKWAISLLLKQAALRLLSEEQTVDYTINQQPMALHFNPRPAYLSLGIVHFF